jgi:Uncharacterised nucleotidyltransferase
MLNQPKTDVLAGGAITDLLAALVRGDLVDASRLAMFDTEGVQQQAANHGVRALITERLVVRDDVDSRLRDIFDERAHDEVAADLLRETELKHLLAELEMAGVKALVMKGAQLAYSHYPRADLRPRVDTDLLIPTTSRQIVRDVLVGLDYQPKRQITGDLVVHQAFYVKRRGDVVAHAVDVHWKIANPQLFAGVLSYEELAEKSVPVPLLGPAARGLCNVHALLLACMHRIAHHYDSDHLIWLYDIHLIARQLRPPEWEQFMELAARRSVVQVCRQSLIRTNERFPTEIPANVWTDPRFGGAIAREATAAYLTNRPHFRAILDDVRALPAWTDRWRLICEHAFPSHDYMRTVYAPSSTAPLAVLYAQRALRGARKWAAQP